jgi:excinuclease ABC subunit A
VLYILDEPTVGLHHDDVLMLLEIIFRLVDSGNTVVIIEHNLDIIGRADWIIDLGPEGGDRGGSVVFEGTPEGLQGSLLSYTGRYLKEYS